MNILLDTNVLVWALAAPRRLRADAQKTIESRDNVVYVSAVSAWEIAIKVALGRLPAPADVATWLPREMEAAHFTALPITIGHAALVENLPLHHRDPFDRLLIAQARAGGLTLMSGDSVFSRYDVDLIRC